MNYTLEDELIFRAFLATLYHVDALDSKVESEIKQLSSRIEEDFSSAMEELSQIIYQDKSLNDVFQAYYDKLMKHQQPRNKCVVPLDEGERLPERENKEIRNSDLSRDSLEEFKKEVDELFTKEVDELLKMLKSTDTLKISAEKMVKKISEVLYEIVPIHIV